jgi:hypothetical protein
MREIRRVFTTNILCWSDGIRLEGQNIVFGSLFGPRNAVRAIWAYLVMKKSAEVTIEGLDNYFKLDTSKYLTIQAPLDKRGGGLHLTMLQSEATNQLSAWSKSFYQLGSDTYPWPFGETPWDSFWGKLTRMCTVPLRPAWKDQMWEIGRQSGLITELDGFGVPVFSVSTDNWFKVVMHNIQAGVLV